VQFGDELVRVDQLHGRCAILYLDLNSKGKWSAKTKVHLERLLCILHTGGPRCILFKTRLKQVTLRCSSSGKHKSWCLEWILTAPIPSFRVPF